MPLNKSSMKAAKYQYDLLLRTAWTQPPCSLGPLWGWLSTAGMDCVKLGSLPAHICNSMWHGLKTRRAVPEMRPWHNILKWFHFTVLAGRTCEENVDDCVSDSGVPRCFNGGQCIDQIGGYSCLCLPGFAGERCEGDINECLSNPCNPRGSLDCVQLVNDYTCICRSAFTGE